MQAGSKDNLPISFYIRDNTGENISHKNKSYCELTVLYWIWKNSDADIIGLTHHRRFFFNQKLIPQILNTKEIEGILTKKEIIIPKPVSVGESVETQYRNVHIGGDYDICREVIKENFREFLKSFDVNSNQKFLHPYNMLITRKEILNDYCSFLFPLLEQIEKQVDISTRDTYQQRVYGFLAERLFQTWLLKNSNLDTMECSVYNIENSIMKQKVKEILR